MFFMKTSMSKRAFLTLGFMVLGVAVSMAAPPPPPSGGPACWPPPCIPIDGGISFLIAAGAIYGGKKLYDKNKKVNPEL